MLNMSFRVLAKYFDVSQIDKACLPFELIRQYLQCVMKRHWRVRQAEYHAFELERATMANKNGLIALFGPYRHLLVSTATIKGGGYL